MNIRERLYTIPDLILSKRLQLMSDLKLEDYIEKLHSFVDSLPEEEALLRAAIDTNDTDAVIKRLAGIREILLDIHADNLAAECWKRINETDKKPEKITAYAIFMISLLSVLSIDIQMVFYNESGEIPAPREAEPEETETVKTILAVDDDSYFMESFKYIMKDVPCNIIEASSGMDALKKMEETIPDLFVLDIEMPGMNGIELALEIKKLGLTSPIIFITGNAKREYVLKCLQAGALDFIIKPLNPKNAVGRITKFL